MRLVGIGELKVSADPGDVLVTHALGSCLGIAAYDPNRRAGGLLHAMLPRASDAPERARSNPTLFVDTGLARLFRSLYALGCERRHIQIRAAGCANFSRGQSDVFRVGEKNIATLRTLLARKLIPIHAEDVGGSDYRTLAIRLSDGQVAVRTAAARYLL